MEAFLDALNRIKHKSRKVKPKSTFQRVGYVTHKNNPDMNAKRVPLIRETMIDYSKYTPERLRDVRAAHGVGRPVK